MCFWDKFVVVKLSQLQNKANIEPMTTNVQLSQSLLEHTQLVDLSTQTSVI